MFTAAELGQNVTPSVHSRQAGCSTLGFDAARFQTTPPACYGTHNSYPDRTYTGKRRRGYESVINQLDAQGVITMADNTIPAANQACLEVCAACAHACDNCVYTCCAGNTNMAECMRLCLDCAAVCHLCEALLARGSAFAERICNVCAEICAACAAECERCGADTCGSCARTCRTCAERCRAVTTG